MIDADHEVNYDVIGQWSEELDFTVGRDHTIAFAEATNDVVKQHTDGIYAPPVFAVIPPFNLMAATTMGAVPDDLMMRILHGEQDMRFHRPTEPGDVLTSRAKVVGIHGRSSGVVVTTLIESRAADGALVNEQFFSGFFRGGRLDGGRGDAAPEHPFDEALRARTPDAQIVQAFDPDQTFRYAAASGDPMPIHTDDEFAKEMGLPGIIVHGLCTMAFTARAVIDHACAEDPSRLKRLVVRFSSPAQPKHVLTTSIWNIGTSALGGSYVFETVTDEGKAVIKDGFADVAR